MLGSLKRSASNAGWAALSGAGDILAINWAGQRHAKNPTGWLNAPRMALLVAFGAPLLPFRGARTRRLLEMASVQAVVLYLGMANAEPVPGKPNGGNLLDRVMQRLKADFSTKPS